MKLSNWRNSIWYEGFHSMRRMSSRPRIATFVATVAMVAVLGSATAYAHPPVDQGGKPSVVSAVDKNKAKELSAAAAGARDKLGFPVGSTQSTRHVQLEGGRVRSFDEVTESDATGAKLNVINFAANGKVGSAVRFSKRPDKGRTVTPGQAVAAARQAASDLGMPTWGQPIFWDDPSTGGWRVRWDRNEQDVRVRGDSTTASIWPDGRVEGISSSERTLAARPKDLLNRSDVEGRVVQSLTAAGANVGSFTITSADMAWVAANSTFDPNASTGADDPLEFVWVITIVPSSASVQSIDLYMKADTALLIGGDIVE